MKHLKILMIAVLALFAYAAKAQTDDYFITTKGDTVKCKISFAFMNGQAQYTLPGGKPTDISIDNVFEYMIKSSKVLYRAVYRDDATTPLFTQVLENGKISLYEVEVTVPSENNTPYRSNVWYIGKGNSSKVNYLYGNAYVEQSTAPKERTAELAEMLKDDPAINKKFAELKKFKIKTVRKLIRQYNAGRQA